MPTLLPRTSFLLGSALAAFAVSLAAPASAQSAPGSWLATSGNVVSRSEQTQAQTTVEANIIDGQIGLKGSAVNADLVIEDETLAAASIANQSAAILNPVLVDSGLTVSTSLAIGTNHVSARGAALTASRQTADDTYAASRISGYPVKMQLGAALGDVTGSRVAITRTREETSAMANDSSSRLTIETSLPLPGAAVLSDQSMRGASTVLSDQGGAAIVTADRLISSQIDLSGNTQRALAQGNGTSNQVVASSASLTGQSGPESLSLVAGDHSAAQVGSTVGVLSSQSAEGRIAAHSNGALHIEVAGGANASRIAGNGNVLLASAIGNRSQDSLRLETGILAATPVIAGPFPAMGRTGAAANVTNVQIAGNADITGSSHVAPRIAIGGDAASLSASIDGTSVRALATANVAEANELAVRGRALGSYVMLPPIGGVGGGWPPLPPVGTALADHEGTMSATATFSIQNSQVSRARTATWLQDGLVSISAGQVRSSDLSASDNDFAAITTGNRASNLLDLEAATIASSADLNSVQVENGNLASYAGQQGDPAGVVLGATSGAADTAFRISGNSVEASTTANIAVNGLEAAASLLVNASGHSDGRAGHIPGGTGASADFALANLQRAAGVEADPETVLAQADGKFGVSAGALTERILVDISGNELSARSTGNNASNSLALTAASMGGNGAAAPYAALSNSQTGSVNGIAHSTLFLEAPGNAQGSEIRLDGNSNTAFSVINMAANSVSIGAADVTGLGGMAAIDGGFASPSAARGDHVLSSHQIAMGTASATTSTQIVLPGSSSAQGSEVVLENSRTVAAASANDATNSLAGTAVNQNRAASALLNSQASAAAVSAHATQTLGEGIIGSASGHSDYSDSRILADARANQASNAMHLAAAPAVPASSMNIAGPLNAVPGGPLLANVQENTGSVTSAAVSGGMMRGLTGGALNGGMHRMDDNAFQAVAFGNSASNVIDGLDAGSRVPAAMLSSLQSNSGVILATAYSTGPAVPSPSGWLGARMTGNVISAQAIGNSSANSIGSRR